MKKATLIALSMMVIGVGSLKAQIFLDNGESNRSKLQTAEAANLLDDRVEPMNNLAPIGEGMLLLAGLAGCYLFGKKTKRS